MDHDETGNDEKWRARLTPEQYRVARLGGTERAFAGAYWNTKEPGVYRCVCCGSELFTSDHKFDSGTGWPSYWQPLAEDRVATAADDSLGMARTEAQCAKCKAHLGPRLRRRAAAHRSALLYQFGIARFRAQGPLIGARG